MHLYLYKRYYPGLCSDNQWMREHFLFINSLGVQAQILKIRFEKNGFDVLNLKIFKKSEIHGLWSDNKQCTRFM